MATVLVPQLQEARQEWVRSDFPHNPWPDALVEVNGEAVIPELVEFGKAATGQKVCVITFDAECRLNIWLDPFFPEKHMQDYAVWNRSPFYNLSLSTCPAWRMHRCSRCQVKVLLWDPPEHIIVDIKFCERDDHKRLPATPHARVEIRNRGCTQKRFGVEA